MSESSNKLESLVQIDCHGGVIVCSVGVKKEDGIICLSLDRSLKVWIKRSSGQYWPSISYSLPTQAYSMTYMEECLCLYVGLETGVIMEFVIAEDYNKLSHTRSYSGHVARVTGVKRVVGVGGGDAYLLTVSKDRSVRWHGMRQGGKASSFEHSVALSCVEYDKQTSCIYAGDNKGSIIVLSHTPPSQSLSKSFSIKKHCGRVECLLVSSVADKSVLLSAAVDACICLFDLSLPELPLLYRLSGHRSPILCLHHHPASCHLTSSSTDGQVIRWDLKAPRSPPPQWQESDECDICKGPFYWNLSKMWNNKTLGVRQHHCRVCGRALCLSCCNDCLIVPSLGFELPTRVCASCFKETTKQKQTTLCTRFQLPSSPTHLHHETTKNILIVSTIERTIQIFNGDL